MGSAGLSLMLLSSIACQGLQAAQDLGSSICHTRTQSKTSIKPAQNQSSPSPHWQGPAYSQGKVTMKLPQHLATVARSFADPRWCLCTYSP